jgi:hypothetical protein
MNNIKNFIKITEFWLLRLVVWKDPDVSKHIIPSSGWKYNPSRPGMACIRPDFPVAVRSPAPPSAGFWLRSFFDPEDGGDMVFEKFGLSPISATLQPRRQQSPPQIQPRGSSTPPLNRPYGLDYLQTKRWTYQSVDIVVYLVIRKTMKNFSQDSRYPGRDSNRAPPE